MIWKYGDQIGWGPFVQGGQIFGDHLSRGTKFDGDRLSRGTKLVGDHLSMGTKFLGTICPWGQEVGDRKSGDQMCLGPNESQPIRKVFAKSQHTLRKLSNFANCCNGVKKWQNVTFKVKFLCKKLSESLQFFFSLTFFIELISKSVYFLK